MLSENIKITQKESQGFEPLPNDVFPVELLDITSENRATYDTRLKPIAEQKFEKVLNFQFTLLDGMEDGKSLRGRNLWMNFVPTYFYVSKKNGKNKLYKIVEALLGHEITQDDYAALEGDATSFLNALVGKQCRVLVESKVVGDKIFSNIANLMKSNTPISSLTSEEKEKAKAKVKTKTQPSIQEGDPNFVDVNQIPF